MKLWQKVTIGLLLGVIFGVVYPEYVEIVKPIGDLFLRAIKMVITPLIFFSLVAGITSMSDPSSLGRVGMKATFAFLSTTFFAVMFGIGIATLLQPGAGTSIVMAHAHDVVKTTEFDIKEFIINIVPASAVGSLAEGNVLQVVFLSLFTGIVMNHMGSSVTPLKNIFHVSSKLVLKMISLIVEMSPYGSFALTAWVVGTQGGVGVLLSLSKLVFAVVIAMVFQYGIFGLIIAVFGRISPMPFYKKSVPYQILAFSTSSSKATLATTMQVCRESMGVSESSASFILPLGAAINMDGFAINLSLTTLFFAQLLGVHLELHDYFVIIVMSTLGSIGGAGIPGASLIMLPMVLSSVNLPIEGVALIAGIDRILDMLRTTINITGDATITLIVDSSEGTLDKEQYYA